MIKLVVQVKQILEEKAVNYVLGRPVALACNVLSHHQA